MHTLPSGYITNNVGICVIGIAHISSYVLCRARILQTVSVIENCRATVGYTDSTGREWVPDGNCVKGGEVRELEGDNRDVMPTLRLFTAHKSCYTIGLNKGKRALIRASFKYGNYDGRVLSPKFCYPIARKSMEHSRSYP